MRSSSGIARAAFAFMAVLAPMQAQLLLTGPNNLTFTATAGGANPATQSVAIRHTGDTPKQFTVAVSTITGGNWLSASLANGVTPARLTVAAVSQGLPAGIYSGSITLISSGVPNARVDVTLAVTTAAGLQSSVSSLAFTRQLGGEVSPDEQLIFVNSTGAAATFTVTATTADGGSWLLASAVTPTTPGVISVKAIAGGLGAGNYTGNIAIAAQGMPTVTIPVSLAVSASTFLVANPASVNLVALRTGNAVTQTVQLQGTSPVPFTVGATTTSGGNWLIVTPLLGAAPGNLDVSANPVGLGPGTYTGTITLSLTGAATSTLTIPVSFTVTDFPVVNANPRSLTQTISTGQGSLVRELAAISVTASSANTNYTVAVSTLNGGPWLTAGPSGSTAPSTVTSVVDATGLTPGTYRGTITIGGGGNVVVIPVTLVVTSSAALVVDPPSLVFNFQKGQTQPSNQILNITSTGAAYAYQSAVTSITPANATWLNGGASTGTTPGTMTLGINAAAAQALPAGQYSATITFSGQAGVTPAPPASPKVEVILNVSETPLFNVSPATMDFTVPVNSAPPALRTIAVTATDNSSRAFTAQATTTSGGNWLLVGPTAGNTPTNLSVQVAPFGLPVGIYEGTVQVTVPSVSATPQSVRVRLIVQGTASGTVNPTSLSFTQAAGGAPPAARTIAITATNTANYQVTTATVSGGNWLSVTPAGGATPGTLTVSVNGGNLAAGTYTGSIGISSSDVTNSPLVIPVTLTITAPSLTITPAALTLLAAPGSTTPVTQTLAVAAGNGTFTTNVNTTSGGNWLTISPASGTAPATVTVTANPTGLPAGSYTGFITFNATGVGNSPQVVQVTFNIATAPPPGRQLIAQVADGSGWKTTITLVNLDTEPAPYTLRFFASDGTPLRLPFEGTPGRLEVLEGIIPIGGSRTILTSGTDNNLAQGWAELSSTRQVSGLGVFRQRVQGRADQEAGVSATIPTSRFVLPFDNTAGFVSSMAIVNTNTAQARAVTNAPRDEAGNPLAGDSVNLPARGHTAFEMASRFPAMAQRRGAADFSSSGADFSALGLRFNPGGAFTSLPTLDVPLSSEARPSNQIISQVADGSGWKTSVTLVNLDTVPAPFTLRFWRQNGTALQVPLAGIGTTEVIEGTIPVGGTRVIETQGIETAELVQGWANLETQRLIGGLAVFRQRAGGRPDQEAAVTLTSTATRFVLPFDNTDNFVTSMALVNASATLGGTISVIIRDEAGQQIGADTVTLTGRGHTAFALTERLAQTRNRRGTVEFNGNGTQITGLGLRFNPGGAFTSFPVLPKR